MFKSKDEYLETIGEMLSQINIKEIEKLILSSTDADSIDIKFHLNAWAGNKAHLYRMFGSKFRIEQEVDNNVPESEFRNDFEVFERNYLTTEPRAVLLHYFLKSFVNKDEMIKNEISRDIVLYGLKLQTGTKISRIMSKLLPADLIDKTQTAYSMFLQKFNGKGKAVISIHPIDYLTMSENTSGWRSCHALDGEYRAGTLAYMMDTTSTIAYVTNSKFDKSYVEWDNGTRKVAKMSVDNKSWRQVVLFKAPRFEEYLEHSVPFAVQSRQYPAIINSYSNAVSKLIEDVMSSNLGDTYSVRKKLSVSFLQELVENEDCAVWYNDIYHGSFDYGRAVYQTSKYESTEDLARDNKFSPATVGYEGIPCVCGCRSAIDEGDTLLGYGHRDEDYWDEDED